MEKLLQITKAPIAKIWHVLKAKTIAALEKYVSMSRFGHDYVETLDTGQSNHRYKLAM